MYSRRQLLAGGLTTISVFCAGCNVAVPGSNDRTYQTTIHNTTQEEKQALVDIDLESGEEITQRYRIDGKKAVSTEEFDSPITGLVLEVGDNMSVQFKYVPDQECPGKNDNITVLIEDTNILAAGACGEIHMISARTPLQSNNTGTAG